MAGIPEEEVRALPGKPVRLKYASGPRLQSRHNLYNKIRRQTTNLKIIKNELRKIEKGNTARSLCLRKRLYGEIKKIRLNNHTLRKVPYANPNKRGLRLFYVRYADDWILLSNADKQIAEKMKSMIKNFLIKELEMTLSEEKTLITDIREEPAHFLGFELRRAKKGRLVYIRGRLQHAPGFPILTFPDRQRIIDRLHAKGFCDKKGFPISIPWLSNLEPHIIIQRFNASMLGLMQYYCEWISQKSFMNRWVYIIRYSCFKTLAMKYKRFTISKVFRKFGVDLTDSSNKTIQATVELKIGNVTYEKVWKLYTTKELRITMLKQGRVKKLSEIFLSRESNEVIGEYQLNSSMPTVTHENYLRAITWVSLRTQASFDLPCSLCGTSQNVEMHHIKHIRKTAFSKMPQKTSLKMMSIRNRKSIPVCRYCHMNVIHEGKYSGEALNTLLNINPGVLDNRIINIEAYINPSKTAQRWLLW